MTDDRSSIVAYIEDKANLHERHGMRPGAGKNAAHHSAIAAGFRALASDVRAGLDLPNTPNTFEDLLG